MQKVNMVRFDYRPFLSPLITIDSAAFAEMWLWNRIINSTLGRLTDDG